MENRLPRRRTVIELLGALGIIGSLIFVGIEIRQNSKATRAAATQQLGQSWVDWNVATATREIHEAILVVEQYPDPSNAPEVDRRIVESYVRSLLSNWSISHYQFRMGVLDAPLWDGVMRDMEGSVDRGHAFGRLLTWVWARNRHLYNVHFTSSMDSLIDARASR